jgi:hypothetical protein
MIKGIRLIPKKIEEKFELNYFSCVCGYRFICKEISSIYYSPRVFKKVKYFLTIELKAVDVLSFSEMYIT